MTCCQLASSCKGQIGMLLVCEMTVMHKLGRNLHCMQVSVQPWVLGSCLQRCSCSAYSAVTTCTDQSFSHLMFAGFAFACLATHCNADSSCFPLPPLPPPFLVTDSKQITSEVSLPHSHVRQICFADFGWVLLSDASYSLRRRSDKYGCMAGLGLTHLLSAVLSLLPPPLLLLSLLRALVINSLGKAVKPR